jgi:hypothetical protein
MREQWSFVEEYDCECGRSSRGFLLAVFALVDCAVCGGFRDHIPPLWDLVSRVSGFGSRLDLDGLDWIIFFPMISASYSIPR